MKDSLLDDLKGENNFAFGALYQKYFDSVKYFVLKNNGSTADAADVFQDTMLVLIEKMRKDNFVLTASIKTYIVAISKNIWYKKLRNAGREIAFEQMHESNFFEEINLDIEREKTYADRMKGYMLKITEHCSRLINDIFYKGKELQEIQAQYGYTSRHNAVNQKHKCISQIRKIKEQEEKQKNNL